MKLLIASLFVALMGAVPASAHDNGEGLAGETTDKLITFFSLGVVLFFTLVVILGSTIQHLLDKRKDEKKAARLRQRTGW
jgi:nitrogen fixation/metabolism regulation signal transduction histidine kinase